jgi:hypothetical protein
MIANNKRGARRGTGKRRTQRRNNGSVPTGGWQLNAVGDIPRTRKYDQESASARRPRETGVHTFRFINEANAIQYSTSAQAGNFYFKFSDLQNATDLSTLFDQYRMDYVKLILKPACNAIAAVASGVTTYPPLYVVIDYDDSTNLSGTSAAMQYDNCMLLEAHESASRAIIPRLASAVYSGAFTSFANVGPQWIDVGSTNVQHYGYKWYLPATTLGQTLAPYWDVQYEIVVSLRSTR